MRALEKAGLVELDGRQPASATATAADAVPPPAHPSASADPSPAPGREPAATRRAPPARSNESPPPESRPFEAIYAEATLPASTFPAEKLLKILDGLQALEPTSRKAAVLALDAADEAWTIDDALLDAERKARALESARKQLEDNARAALEQAREDVTARDQRQQEAVARIRQQIADLEGLLEREVARATEEKAALQQAALSTKQACVREAARYDDEAQRLRRLAEIFAASAPPPSA